jgi:hypothetical protein
MATSIICCCASIYRSVMPDLSFFGSLGSWASQPFRGTSSRSKTSVHTGANKSTHTTNSKGPKKGPTGFSKHGAPCEQIDEGSSERELAWTEVRASDDEDRSVNGGIPLRTVKIEQSVEAV